MYLPRMRCAYPGYEPANHVARIRPQAASGTPGKAWSPMHMYLRKRTPDALRLSGLRHSAAQITPRFFSNSR